MSKPVLKIGFDVPFHEAIKAAKERGVVLPGIYYGELQGLARQLSFSIAGIAALDQLQQVRDSLSDGLQSGISFVEWQDEILKSGTLDLPEHRLDNIFRTNIQNSYNRGRWEKFQSIKHRRPYLMYDAINDSRVRPSHLAMDGIIRPADDFFWRTHAPSNGYRCFLPGTKVRGDFKIGLKSFYTGKAVEIVSSDRSRLAVTANHPVLTGRGWVPAGEINETDNLLRDRSRINTALPGIVNNKKPPATVEHVFDSLSAEAVGVCDISSFDFNNDARLRKRDVYVSGADCVLMDGFRPARNKRVDNREFVFTDHATSASSDRLAAKTNSVLSEYSAYIASANIVRNDIVSIRHFNYNGYVYDFETETGLIIADGLIAHNCRCRLISLSEKQAQRRSGDDRGLNKHVEPAEMQPDDGWDYNPGDDLTEGVRRAIDQKPDSAIKTAAIEKIIMAEDFTHD